MKSNYKLPFFGGGDGEKRKINGCIACYVASKCLSGKCFLILYLDSFTFMEQIFQDLHASLLV